MPDEQPTQRPEAFGEASFDATVASAPMHSSDRVPDRILRVHAWLSGLMSSESRLVLGIFIVVLAVVVALLVSSLHILRTVFDALNVITFAGLFLVNWLGNGGALVPIPGARLLGLLMVFQHAAFYPWWAVFFVAGSAMALGLLSYYLAGVRAADSYNQGDESSAEQLATEIGMLDDPGPGDAVPSTGPDRGDATSLPNDATVMKRLRDRFARTLRDTQATAQPIIEKHGVLGMFWLCLPPTPLGTAGAFVGGLMRFGFSRFLAISFAAKYLLAGIVVIAGLIFSGAAEAVTLPF